LQNIFEVNIPDSVFEDIKSIIDMRKADDIIAVIEPISEFFMKKINEKTLDFLNDNNIPLLNI
jgi:hypothetical protein